MNHQQNCRTAILVVATLMALAIVPAAPAQVRIKDISTVEGVRINQLTGLGLITGLNNTGGKSPVTRRFALNMIERFGLRADPSLRLLISTDTTQKTNNLSVVTVTAQLPMFAKQGSRIDVTVSAFDDAASLQGGTLMTTPLFGVDNEVYAVAAGPISVGGFSFGGDAATVQKNHPTSGRIANGATVENEICWTLGQHGSFRLLLNHSDFLTATRVAAAINAIYPGVAKAEDSLTVKVLIPSRQTLDPIAFVASLTSLSVTPDMLAKVVINERTGTVVMGDHVRISPVAITHANLAVITTESPEVSQPAPFSDGVTTVVPRTTLDVIEEKKPVQVFPASTTVGDLASALNQLGVTPRDMSSIFQQLHAAGALHADLEFN